MKSLSFYKLNSPLCSFLPQVALRRSEPGPRMSGGRIDSLLMIHFDHFICCCHGNSTCVQKRARTVAPFLLWQGHERAQAPWGVQLFLWLQILQIISSLKPKLQLLKSSGFKAGRCCQNTSIQTTDVLKLFDCVVSILIHSNKAFGPGSDVCICFNMKDTRSSCRDCPSARMIPEVEEKHIKEIKLATFS